MTLSTSAIVGITLAIVIFVAGIIAVICIICLNDKNESFITSKVNTNNNKQIKKPNKTPNEENNTKINQTDENTFLKSYIENSI